MSEKTVRTLPARIWYGDGMADRIPAALDDLDVKRVFLVTDPGVAEAGHADRVRRVFEAAGAEVRVFADVGENPTSDHCAAAAAALGAWDADVIVGVGGGSSIDVSKGVAFLQAGGGRMEDYCGHATARGTLLPIVAVPTTAGTGTETQSFALISDPSSHAKMACGDPQALPRLAVLDPTLTVTQPPFVTACSAIDALGHALETAVTRARGVLSAGYSRDAFLMIEDALPRVLQAPDDLPARGELLLAAAFAGIAIEHSMLGAAHSMANPLTAHHGIEHGRAVGLALAPVIRFNGDDGEAAAIYASLAKAARLVDPDAAPEVAVEALASRVEELMAAAGLASPRPVLEDIPLLAEEAAGQWTAQFNPRPVEAGALAALYESVAAPDQSAAG